MGSKSRIAKYIVPIIQNYINENQIKTYCEPFGGGMNVVDKITCETKYASDSNKYLIALLKHVQNDKLLYETVSRELYNRAKTAYKTDDNSEFQDWELGNIGFLASFNGKFFDGGYARPGYEKTKNGERYRDYYRESKDNLLKQAPYLKNIEFSCKDYKDVNPTGNWLIYCDPPYANVTQYANATRFDYDEFWNIMRGWSENNIVLISEETAPDDFDCIWQQDVTRSLNASDKMKSTEKLFKLKRE